MAKDHKPIPLNRSVTERVVSFDSKGTALFGILHTPDAPTKTGIIFLNSGPQYRVGPHRMYVKAARRFCRLGFSVLRMDFPGIGDSEGEIGHIHYDCYDPADTLNAIEFLCRKEGLEHIILLGTCAGARNALKTAAQDIRVTGVVLWSLPMITFSLYTPISQHTQGGSISKVAAQRYVKNWMKKLFQIKAWKRYLFSGTDRVSIKTVANTLWGLTGLKRKAEATRHREFLAAFDTLVTSPRKTLFIYGEKDVILREEFEQKFTDLKEAEHRNCDYLIIPGGDHTFTSLKAERMVIDETANWLVLNFETKLPLRQTALAHNH